MCVTDRHDMTLAVKVALNPNTSIHPLTVARKNALNSVTLYVEICYFNVGVFLFFSREDHYFLNDKM